MHKEPALSRDFSSSLSQLSDLVTQAASGKPLFKLAIAGPPGSGKSTLASALQAQLGRRSCTIPMDGFHQSNAELEEKGLLSRKGAPETFDSSGFAQLVADLGKGRAHRFPTFDRAADRVVPEGGQVLPETEILIFEGNYLLFDHPDWRSLHDHWDASIWLDVPIEVLRARLVQRWLAHGLTKPKAQRRADGNDMKNAVRIVNNLIAPTWRFHLPERPS